MGASKLTFGRRFPSRDAFWAEVRRRAAVSGREVGEVLRDMGRAGARARAARRERVRRPGWWDR